MAIGILVGFGAARGRPPFPFPLIGLAVVGVVIFISTRRGRRMAGMGWRLRQLTEAARRLEAVDERRRGFLADLAHELRTPLAVIRAQSEAISDGVYPGDPEHLAPILDAARTMEALVADLRTLVESDAGALSLARESVALAELIPEVVAAQRPQAPEVSLTADVPSDLPAVDADPARLRRVLVNLLQNAVAHTPAGGSVHVRAERAGDMVSVTVADSGAGMEPELAARAFERFAKSPASRGSGLGLSIAKDIVEAHGGTIDLRSEPGRGTTVRFTLPLSA